MQAETLNCPMCGAPAASDATACAHCGARLATVACPSCFGMIFEGAKFCSHCGAKVERTDVAAAAPQPCPRCKVNLGAVLVGTTNLLECAKCEGVWVDVATLQQICDDREKQAAVLGMAAPLPTENIDPGNFRYVPCPVCQTLMNRVNFANCSHVIVDVCTKHGTWFDKDELRKMIEFIRAGGMEQSRTKQIAELERERSLLKSDQTSALSAPVFQTATPRYDGYDLAVDLVGAAISTLFKL
jgi:Zn-finger nucleic acid-binding protein